MLKEVMQKRKTIKIRESQCAEELKVIENNLDAGLPKMKEKNNKLLTEPRTMQCGANLTADEDSSTARLHTTKGKKPVLSPESKPGQFAST